jgi:hypothetical protein
VRSNCGNGGGSVRVHEGSHWSAPQFIRGQWLQAQRSHSVASVLMDLTAEIQQRGISQTSFEIMAKKIARYSKKI